MPVTHLRFGIPSLDWLLQIPKSPDDRRGVRLGNATISACVSGSAGTGKSVLALHLAAQYAADLRPEDQSRVIYASTDLSMPQAKKAWDEFGLSRPASRTVPFEQRPQRPEGGDSAGGVELREYSYDPAALATYIHEPPGAPGLRVGFVNLQRSTAGDDWGFINRLIACLPEQAGPGLPKHLVVVDAVEGLETLAGDIDSFGILRARRSRVAQVLRTAGQKCHILFIVEDLRVLAREAEENPEDYVTDIVLRLGNAQVRQYRRRFLEIVKVRFGSHVRGEHQLLIRDGTGSKTGTQTNYDDPDVPSEGSTQAYVHVVASLHAVNRQGMRLPDQRIRKPPTNCFAEFGIEHLDNMLARRPKGSEDEKKPSFHNQGLPCGKLTALIGEEGTQKTRLAEAFIARAFAPWAHELSEILAGRLTTPPKDWEEFVAARGKQGADGADLWSDLASRTPEEAKWGESFGLVAEYFYRYWGEAKDCESTIIQHVRYRLVEPGPFGQAAVYLCTGDTDVDVLAERCLDKLCFDFGMFSEAQKLHQAAFRTGLGVLVRHYLICRRLEIHDMSTAVLAHIIREAVFAARAKLICPVEESNDDDLHKQSSRIRTVIDDFRLMRKTYPDIADDALFLPHLRFFFGRAGVTALVVESLDGRRDAATPEGHERELQSLADHRLHTFRVPFQGYSRIAIAAVPPIGDGNPVLVREVASRRLPSKPIYVDPNLELWDGLLEGSPKRVGLEVRLAALTPLADKYAGQADTFLKGLFTPSTAEGRIVPAEPPSYESLRTLCYLQTDVQLDQTLVFTVDEFWGRDRRTGLRDCGAYLATVPDADADGFADPHQIFIPRRERHRGVAKFKHFVWAGNWNEQTDRIPYVWDFGFLLCQELAWRESYPLQLPVLARTVQHLAPSRPEPMDPGNALQGITVRQVAEIARFAGQDFSTGPRRLGRSMEVHTRTYFVDVLATCGIPPQSWRVFLEACSVVAAHSPAGTPSRTVHAFDVDMLAPETFSCLVLEMWMSEILLRKTEPSTIDWLIKQASRERMERPSFRSLVRNHRDELFAVIILLAEVFEPGQFVPSDSGFEFSSRECHSHAVAARHWYSTASHAVQTSHDTDRLVAVRLPGSFSVRGDWFLATANGSRSMRLADEALDVLSSRRANYDRLQLGIGLPTRDILQNSPEGFDSIRTALAVTSKSSRDPGLTYEGLKRLGASKETPDRFGDDFHWLWRSQIAHYDRDRGVWLKWLWRAISRLLDRKRGQRAEWTSGFKIYDDLWHWERLKLPTAPTHPIATEFEGLIDVLLRLLPDEFSEDDDAGGSR